MSSPSITDAVAETYAILAIEATALRKANAAAAAEIRVAMEQLDAAMPRAQRLCHASDLVRVRVILGRALEALTGPAVPIEPVEMTVQEILDREG